MSRMFTADDFEQFGKVAAKKYIEDNTALNDTIVKVAEHYGLNPEQTRRVIEHANVETYLKINKSSDDKYVEFDAANVEKIASALDFEQLKQAAIDSDYMEAVTNDDFRVFTKVAESKEEQITEDQLDQAFYKLAHIRTRIQNRREEVDAEFAEESENLYNLVKQAVLGGNKFGLIKQAMTIAAPGKSTDLIIDIVESKLEKEASHISLDEEIDEAPGRLNKNHPIVQSITKLSILKEEYKDLHKTDKELEKCGISAGEYLKSSLQWAKDTKDYGAKQLKDALKFLKSNKAVPAGIAGLGILGIGYKIGENERQKDNSPMNPKRRNISAASKTYKPI